MEVVASYIELGLRLGRHIDGLVDAYYGPPELAQQVDAEEVQAPAKLARDAAELRESIDDRWLNAQLVGLETVASHLAGEEIPFEDEVERCYGVRPQRTPEDVFEAAHRELDELLPGTGSLGERYRAWREGNVVPADRLGEVFAGAGQRPTHADRERVRSPTGRERRGRVRLRRAVGGVQLLPWRLCAAGSRSTPTSR